MFGLKTLLAAVAVGATTVQPVFARVYDHHVSNHTAVLGYVQIFYDNAESKTEVLHKDLGNGIQPHDFVYDDPRATWRDSTNIKIGVKEGRISKDENLHDPVSWYYKSITAWTENSSCSRVEFDIAVLDSSIPGATETAVATGQTDLSLVQADLTQVGFVESDKITVFRRGTGILGACFTMLWSDEHGNFTDYDNDGKLDVAFREIYYNDLFRWSDIDEVPPFHIDFPTIAVHEVGHGLSLSHFGTVQRTKDGLTVKPRAVMSPIYDGKLREPTGRDKGAFCNAWANWPH